MLYEKIVSKRNNPERNQAVYLEQANYLELCYYVFHSMPNLNHNNSWIN